MIGPLVVTLTLRAGYVLPEEERDFGPRECWPDHWIGSIEPGTGVSGGATRGEERVAADGGTAFEDMHSQDMSLGVAWLPYILVAALLVVTRIVGPGQDFLLEFQLVWETILGTPYTEGSEILYLPGRCSSWSPS